MGGVLQGVVSGQAAEQKAIKALVGAFPEKILRSRCKYGENCDRYGGGKRHEVIVEITVIVEFPGEIFGGKGENKRKEGSRNLVFHPGLAQQYMNTEGKGYDEGHQEAGRFEPVVDVSEVLHKGL